MAPLSREFLLARGYCCNLGCLNCPYKNNDVTQSMNTETLQKFKDFILPNFFTLEPVNKRKSDDSPIKEVATRVRTIYEKLLEEKNEEFLNFLEAATLCAAVYTADGNSSLKDKGEADRQKICDFLLDLRNSCDNQADQITYDKILKVSKDLSKQRTDFDFPNFILRVCLLPDTYPKVIMMCIIDQVVRGIVLASKGLLDIGDDIKMDNVHIRDNKDNPLASCINMLNEKLKQELSKDVYEELFKLV